MKIILLGCTKFSEEILLMLLQRKFKISAIFTIPPKFKISYSKKEVTNYNYSDLKTIAGKFYIKTYTVNSRPGKTIGDYQKIIAKISPDVIIAAGWYYMVPKKIRDIPTYGAWGIHASLLPNYAGGAPLVWAMINGEKKTGVTLFKLDKGVDDGDIIAQKAFPIEFDDTIKEVYEKATESSKELLALALRNPRRLRFKPQNREGMRVYSQRTPADGRIDLTKSAREIYNFIRAQSAPYPGAFIETRDGKKIYIEKAMMVK